MLTNPEHILIVYGSLAPGKSNHKEIAHISGTWKAGEIHGKLEDRGWGAGVGFPGLVNAQPSKPIEVQILFSEDLPTHWNAIDRFEGDEYVRRLIDFELVDGQRGRGYVYYLRG